MERRNAKTDKQVEKEGRTADPEMGRRPFDKRACWETQLCQTSTYLTPEAKEEDGGEKPRGWSRVHSECLACTMQG